MKPVARWMLLLAAAALPAAAQQFAYPAKGQAPQMQKAQQQAAFQKARAACLEGRGYTVK